MKQITTFILLLALCVCTDAAAQRSVRLTVLEKGTEQPVIAANVAYADNPELRNAMHTITDVDGQTVLKLAGKGSWYYKVTYVSFVPETGKIDKTETVKTVYMKDDALGLNEVVVTGSRAARPIKLSPITTQVLGGKQLVDAGYANLQQALQQETPGLNIQKVGFGNEISMQGLDARHVLFLMDGERMTGDMAGNLDYERFNLHAIDPLRKPCGWSCHQPDNQKDLQTVVDRRRSALWTDERAQLQESAAKRLPVYVRAECRPPQPARLGVSRLQYGQSDLADRCVVQLHRRILYVSGGERQESLYAGGQPFPSP